MNELEQYMRLFHGRTDAYGTGQGRWIKEPPGPIQYKNHLEGHGYGLGIAPLLDDGTVWFAAIDLDEPDFEAAREMQELLSYGVTWIERSRSGNAHIWAFFAEPIQAWIVRGLFKNVTHAMSKPHVEIFPKQDKLLSGMYGNYINLPYHGKERPIVYKYPRVDALDPEFGEDWAIEGFLYDAVQGSNNPKKWAERAAYLDITEPSFELDENKEFGTGKELHKCAEWIYANRDENPVREGHRNAVYFALAKMLSHYEGMDHDEAWEIITKVRDSADEKGIEHTDDRELRRILRNAERGGFTSTGCDDPLVQPYAHPECKIAKGLI